MGDFSSVIIAWYKKNKRDLPWRNTSDPYKIWLSEIILQQTRVDQGMAYYIKFVDEFPTIKDLALASDEKILSLWQGLGYYSRARNLHTTAKVISEKFDGKFPNTFNEIKSLKGIGDYTAAAISSFAYNLPHAVLDGNVFRVLSRYFKIDTPIDSSAAKKEFGELANQLLNKKNPALFNQAIMEFGALQCVPNNPNCLECPLKDSCLAFNSNEVQKYPLKSKKLFKKSRFINYLIIDYKGKNVLKKRIEKDIWQNLYDYPLLETDGEKDLIEMKLLIENHPIIKDSPWDLISVSKLFKHVLSHRDIFTRFYHIRISKKPILIENQILCEPDDFINYGMPRVITRYLEGVTI